MMLESTIHGIQKHLCMLGTESVQQMERSPLHPNALIRDRGDIIISVFIHIGADLCIYTIYLYISIIV